MKGKKKEGRNGRGSHQEERNAPFWALDEGETYVGVWNVKKIHCNKKSTAAVNITQILFHRNKKKRRMPGRENNKEKMLSHTSDTEYQWTGRENPYEISKWRRFTAP